MHLPSRTVRFILLSLLIAAPALAQQPTGVIAGTLRGVDSLGTTFLGHL